MRKRVIAISGAVLLSIATGPAHAATDSGAALKSAVSAYSKAYLTGNGAAAYQLLSRNCRAKLPLSKLAALTEYAAELYGFVPIKTYRATIQGTTAQVTYTYAVAKINQTNQPWVYENGWRNNNC